MKDFFYGFVITLVLVLIFSGIVLAFDTSMDNRDTMLCNSAKVSGNEIYLDKCICFYNGEDIRCITKGLK